MLWLILSTTKFYFIKLIFISLFHWFKLYYTQTLNLEVNECKETKQQNPLLSFMMKKSSDFNISLQSTFFITTKYQHIPHCETFFYFMSPSSNLPNPMCSPTNNLHKTCHDKLSSLIIFVLIIAYSSRLYFPFQTFILKGNNREYNCISF